MNSNSKSNKRSMQIATIACLLVFAVAFELIFSKTTSPLYEHWKSNGVDSGVFQLIGKYWTQGSLPYVDFFDHKGPYLYFVEAVGYAITSSKLGIWIAQIFFLWLTLIAAYYLLKERMTQKISVLFVVFMLGWLTRCFEGGNLTEEFVLPYLMLSFWRIYTWLRNVEENGRICHNPKDAFIYGLTFGVCFLTRITNAIGVCIAVFLITLWLLFHKKWVNILKNIFGFLLGFLVINAPFIVYFTLNGALYEMLYGTLLFNLKYAAGSDWLSIKHIIHTFRLSYSLMIVELFVIFVARNKKHIWTALIYIVISLGTTLSFAKGNGYAHYDIISVPYFVLAILELKWMIEENRGSFIKRNIAKVIVITMSLLSVVVPFKRIVNTVATMDLQDTKYENNLLVYREIAEYIPKEEWESVIGYNISTDFYLNSDIKPCYKYFFLQDWLSSFSYSVKKDIYTIFESGTAKWIVISDDEDSVIKDILDNRYFLIYVNKRTDSSYSLYKLKDGE